MEIQKKVEGLIPTIHALEYSKVQLIAEIAEKEKALQEIPVVQKMTAEIQELKKSLAESEKQEQELREQGKNTMLENGLKEFTMLDGTTVSLHGTPWALVIEDGAVIPEEYYRVKKEVDKTALKKAFNDGKVTDERIYISKDYKFVIKQK